MCGVAVTASINPKEDTVLYYFLGGKEGKTQQHSEKVHKRFSLCLFSNPESAITFVTAPDGCWLPSEARKKEKSFCQAAGGWAKLEPLWLGRDVPSACVCSAGTAFTPGAGTKAPNLYTALQGGHLGFPCQMSIPQAGWGKCGFIHDSIESILLTKIFFHCTCKQCIKN